MSMKTLTNNKLLIVGILVVLAGLVLPAAGVALPGLTTVGSGSISLSSAGASQESNAITILYNGFTPYVRSPTSSILWATFTQPSGAVYGEAAFEASPSGVGSVYIANTFNVLGNWTVTVSDDAGNSASAPFTVAYGSVIVIPNEYYVPYPTPSLSPLPTVPPGGDEQHPHAGGSVINVVVLAGVALCVVGLVTAKRKTESKQ